MQRDDTTSSSTDRRWIRRVVIMAVTLAVAIPAAAWAGHQFTDVPNSNIFHADIEWMADNGVTKGCNPPANTEYCPDDFVTREQMAAFMHRLESEGVFLPADGKAADADELDGMDSSAFLGVNATAADADTVDGVHAGDLVGAGVHVTRDAGDAPVVERWFNNINGTEPTVTGTGTYTIDFGAGFDAENRFVQCTIDTNFVDTRDATCTASTPSATTVRVRIFDPSVGTTAPGEFWVHVYGVAAE